MNQKHNRTVININHELEADEKMAGTAGRKLSRGQELAFESVSKRKTAYLTDDGLGKAIKRQLGLK